MHFYGIFKTRFQDFFTSLVDLFTFKTHGNLFFTFLTKKVKITSYQKNRNFFY